MRERARKAVRWLKRQARIPLSEHLSKGSDVYELAGVGCLVGAAWWWVPIVGLVALGLALIYLGVVTHVPSSPKR
jgi:hypothetical protein